MNYFRRVGKFFRKIGRDGDQEVVGERSSSVVPQQQHQNTNTQSVHVKEYPQVHSDAVASLAAVQPGCCLSGSKDQSVVLFNYEEGNVLQKWTEHQREITKVLYGKKSGQVYSASRDKTAKVFQHNRKEAVRTFAGHDLVVTGLALNEENTHLCTGSRDNTLRMWDVESGQCLQQSNISRNLVTHIKWGKDADMLAQTSEDKEVKIWDTRTLQVVQSFPRKLHIQTCCDLSPDNLYCLTCSNGFGGNGCEATLWDVRNKCVVCEYKGHMETVAACTFLPSVNGVRLIGTSSNDCSVKIWNQDTKECLCSLSLSGAGPLTSIAAYEDNTILVSSFNLGVHVLKLSTDRSSYFHLDRIAKY